MPEVRRVPIVGMGLEYPACRPAIDRYEPCPGAELGPSTRHRTDPAAIQGAPMYELDGAQHTHLADDVWGRSGPWTGLSERRRRRNVTMRTSLPAAPGMRLARKGKLTDRPDRLRRSASGRGVRVNPLLGEPFGLRDQLGS